MVVRGLRMLALLAQVGAVWLVAVLLAPHVGAARRSRLVARLAGQTLAILGVRLDTAGADVPATGPALLVANHVSWLDVYALNAAVGGARHVAKAEVAHWPVAGTIARGFATFFHRRGAIRDAARVKDAVAGALRAGDRVVVFPEGTTTAGDGVGRFHPAFLQAAVDAGVPVRPVAIRYPGPDGAPDPAAAFVGDMTFLESLARVLRRRRLVARLTFGPALPAGSGGRRELANMARAFVAHALDAEPSSERAPLPRAA